MHLEDEAGRRNRHRQFVEEGCGCEGGGVLMQAHGPH